MKNIFHKLLIKPAQTVFFAAIVIVLCTIIVQAGSLTPSASPAATGYTLSDIYTRLTTNATATEADHDLTTSGSPSASNYTLTQIYEAIPTIDATKVLAGTSYLGVAGSLTNVGAQTITPTTSNTAITAGYHNGSGYCAGDADLVAGNIVSGVNLFGVAGSYAGYTYGDASAAKVLTTATGAGTYDASNLTDSMVKLGTSYGVSSTGSLAPNGGTAVAADLFNGKTAHLTGDWSLDTGTLDLACNTATFNATANLVATAYDGAGDGTNRWCMTDSGDAAAGDILTGKTVWVDGAAVSGSLTNVGAQTITPGTSNTTITAGYHNGSGYCAGDADLVASNIVSGVNIFGVAGTYSGFADWSNQKNVRWDDWIYSGGTTGSPFNEYTGEESTWSQTASGGTAASVTDNSVTIALASNVVIRDSRTGLYWTDKTATTVDNEFRYDATGQCNFTDSGTANSYCDNQDPLNAYSEDNDVSANDFCLNLQLDADNADSDSNGLTGVETDWRLPTQKELLQAYIDGSANHLTNPSTNFWSSTEHYSGATWAWQVVLDTGTGSAVSKAATSRYACCVR